MIGLAKYAKADPIFEVIWKKLFTIFFFPFFYYCW